MPRPVRVAGEEDALASVDALAISALIRAADQCERTGVQELKELMLVPGGGAAIKPLRQYVLHAENVRGGWSNLIRDLHSYPPVLQEAVAKLCACRARSLELLILRLTGALFDALNRDEASICTSAIFTEVQNVINALLKRDDNGSLRGLVAGGYLDLDPEDATGEAAVEHLRTRKELEAADSAPIFEPGEGGTRRGRVWRALEGLQATRLAAEVHHIQELVVQHDACSNGALELHAEHVRGGLCNLIRNLHSYPPVLQEAVAKLCACRARSLELLILRLTGALRDALNRDEASICTSAIFTEVVDVINALRTRDNNGSLRGLVAGGYLDLDPEDATGEAAVEHLRTRKDKELKAADSAPIFEPGEGGTRRGRVWRALIDAYTTLREAGGAPMKHGGLPLDERDRVEEAQQCMRTYLDRINAGIRGGAVASLYTNVVQPQTWLSAQELEQLAKISDLWLYIEPVHLQRPIKGVPPDGRVFGGMPFEIGVLNSTGDGVRWGDSMAEAASRLEMVLRAAAPKECGGSGGAGGSYVGSKLSGFKVAQNPPGLNCRALLGRPHGLQTDASERQVGAFRALAAIAPGTVLADLAVALQRLDEIDGGCFSELGLYITKGSPHRDALRSMYYGTKDPGVLKAGEVVLRLPMLLTACTILVLTLRVHLNPAIDALGPFNRLLRAGIYVRKRVVTEKTALPGAADFCLFRPGPNTVAIPSYVDGWRVTANEWDDSRIVWRTPRTYFTGVCLTKQLLSSIFDHGSCGAQHRPLPDASTASEAPAAGEGAAAQSAEVEAKMSRVAEQAVSEASPAQQRSKRAKQTTTDGPRERKRMHS